MSSPHSPNRLSSPSPPWMVSSSPERGTSIPGTASPRGSAPLAVGPCAVIPVDGVIAGVAIEIIVAGHCRRLDHHRPRREWYHSRYLRSGMSSGITVNDIVALAANRFCPCLRRRSDCWDPHGVVKKDLIRLHCRHRRGSMWPSLRNSCIVRSQLREWIACHYRLFRPCHCR